MQGLRFSSSFFQDLRTRELNGFTVRRTPCLENLSSESGGHGAGVVMIEHEGFPSPPLAMSFCKASRNGHFLAVSDEEGFLNLYDTSCKLPSLRTCRENAANARVCDWRAHHNSIFDICWTKDETRILTGSGDQTIKVWDTEKKTCIGVMIAHSGSVKSLCSHPANPGIVVSGSRDGSIAHWDIRCNSSSKNRFKPTAIVRGAHISPHGKRVRRGKAPSMSITSVLYLNDEISIASAGAADSMVKFWDTRNLKAPVGHTHPNVDLSSDNGRVAHGISCLSQDSNGVFLAASCMDHRIYLYDLLQLNKDHIKTFLGSRIETFYVKSAVSPDGAHILGGSSDGKAYIWQVKKPEAGPVVLKGHEGEVTAVDWCTSEVGKLGTSSDDYMVRVWNLQKGSYSNAKSPSSIRRRVTAYPNMKCRKLFMDEPSIGHDPIKPIESICQEETITRHGSSPQFKNTEFETPKSSKKRNSPDSSLDQTEIHKTPQGTMNSPASVLNPPSSIKRTIRDYFVAVS